MDKAALILFQKTVFFEKAVFFSPFGEARYAGYNKNIICSIFKVNTRTAVETYEEDQHESTKTPGRYVSFATTS